MGRDLLAVSRRINVDALAVTDRGKVVVNVALFDVARLPERLLQLGTRQRGRLFIGLELSAGEGNRVRQHVGHGYAEAAAFVVGRRQQGSRGAK